MVPVTALLIPILLAAVIVFLASTVIHMLLPYHRSDFSQVPAEDQVMAALRGFGIAPGNYMMPHARSLDEMKSPAFVEKRERGPVAILTVMGAPSMAKSLVQWFLFCIVVGTFAAYITGRALTPGADYMTVFRFAGATAFIGYSVAAWPNSIWYKTKWSTTLKSTFDGLVYGLLTGGTFGWLWPE